MRNPRYLTTFGSTRSEIVVPMSYPPGGKVVGLIDVKSEQVNALTDFSNGPSSAHGA